MQQHILTMLLSIVRVGGALAASGSSVKETSDSRADSKSKEMQVWNVGSTLPRTQNQRRASEARGFKDYGSTLSQGQRQRLDHFLVWWVTTGSLFLICSNVIIIVLIQLASECRMWNLN